MSATAPIPDPPESPLAEVIPIIKRLWAHHSAYESVLAIDCLRPSFPIRAKVSRVATDQWRWEVFSNQPTKGDQCLTRSEALNEASQQVMGLLRRPNLRWKRVA